MIVALAVEQSRYPHYAGPATCVALALVVASLRHMRAAGRHTGRRRGLPRTLFGDALGGALAAPHESGGPAHRKKTGVAAHAFGCRAGVSRSAGAYACAPYCPRNGEPLHVLALQHSGKSRAGFSLEPIPRYARPPFTDRAEWSEAQLDERMGLERGGHRPCEGGLGTGRRRRQPSAVAVLSEPHRVDRRAGLHPTARE